MPEMTEEERLELCKKLDADLDAYIQDAMKKGPRVEDTRSVDEIAEVMLSSLLKIDLCKCVTIVCLLDILSYIIAHTCYQCTCVDLLLVIQMWI